MIAGRADRFLVGRGHVLAFGGRLPVPAIVALAERALTLDHNDASVAAIAARTLAWGAHDLDTAAYHAERAYALNPNLNTACVISGFVSLWKGNPDRAIEQFQQALRLNPLWVNTPGGIGILGLAHAFLMARRFDEALAASRRAVQFIRNPTTVRTAAASAALAGQHDEASKYMSAVLKLDPSRRISNLGEILGPYQRQQDVELYTQGLRLAGLPE